MNLLAMRTEVLGNSQFDPIAYSSRIDAYINEAQRRIARELDVFELRNTVDLVTVSGTNLADLPADFLRIVSVVNITDLTNPLRLYVVRESLFDETPSGTGAPRYYYVGGRSPRGLRLYPTPDGAYTLRARYQSSPDTLTLDADIPEIPSDYHDLLITYALMRCYRAENDYEAAAILSQNWQADFAKLGTAIASEVEDGPKQVPGTWGSTDAGQGGLSG